MQNKYSVGQVIILNRMHGMNKVPATVQEVYDDHLVVRTHIGMFIKVTERDILRIK